MHSMFSEKNYAYVARRKFLFLEKKGKYKFDWVPFGTNKK